MNLGLRFGRRRGGPGGAEGEVGGAVGALHHDGVTVLELASSTLMSSGFCTNR